MIESLLLLLSLALLCGARKVQDGMRLMLCLFGLLIVLALSVLLLGKSALLLLIVPLLGWGWRAYMAWVDADVAAHHARVAVRAEARRKQDKLKLKRLRARCGLPQGQIADRG